MLRNTIIIIIRVLQTGALQWQISLESKCKIWELKSHDHNNCHLFFLGTVNCNIVVQTQR